MTKDKKKPPEKLVARIAPYITNTAGIVGIIVAIVGVTVTYIQRQKTKAELEFIGLQKQKLEAELNASAPDFTFTYITLTHEALYQLQYPEPDTHPFPGVSLYPSIELMNKDVLATLTSNLDDKDEALITCLMIRQTGKRVAKKVEVEFQRVPLPEPVDINPYHNGLGLPTELIEKSSKGNSTSYKVQLDQLDTGQGYIIPIFPVVQRKDAAWPAHAYKLAFIPHSLRYIDAYLNSELIKEIQIRAMLGAPLKIEGGIRYSG